ncbi:hypothetical protein AwErysi_07760 [Erysipelotrichaceae bacterium]|nr:hypothetical protein AwErysi_07760 [Erysipelotrichaceae bacterium]
MVFIQSILLILRKRGISFLLIVQASLMFVQLAGCYEVIISFSHNEALLASLRQEDETIINITAMVPGAEFLKEEPRNVEEIENLLGNTQVITNKYYMLGGKLNVGDYPPIPTIKESYKYFEENHETEVLIVTGPLKGDFIFSGGGNFSPSDLSNDIKPVILGDAYKSTLKLGDVFEVDMGPSIGNIKLRVHGFLKSSVLQPILTNYLAYSTETFNNYFIIGLDGAITEMLFTPSYSMKTSDQIYQNLQHDVHMLEGNKYSVLDEFSHKKKDIMGRAQKKYEMLSELGFYILLLLLTYGMLTLQMVKDLKREHAILNLLGAFPLFNYIYMLIYFASIAAIGIFFGMVYRIVNELKPGNILAGVTIIIAMLVAMIPACIEMVKTGISRDI